MSETKHSGGDAPVSSESWSKARLLLLLPFIALAWVPSYNSIEPKLGSFPFFYWYQLLWVPLTILIIAIVRRLESRPSSSSEG